MQNFINLLLLAFAENWVFLFAGLLGSVAHRASNYSTVKQFTKNLIVSVFFSILAGISADTFTDWDAKFVFVVCAITSYFTKDIVTEVKEIIASVSDYIANKLNK